MNIKKWVVTAIGAIVVLLIGHSLVQYLTTGHIIVTTNESGNSIVVKEISNGTSIKGGVYSKQSFGKFSARVRPGSYSITVNNKYSAEQEFVAIGARQSKRLTINIGNISAQGAVSGQVAQTTLESVSSQAVYNLAASSNELLFTDLTTGELYKIDSQSNETLLGNGQSFSLIQWADTSFGVAQDSGNYLYTVANGNVSPLSVPFSYGGSLAYAVAPNQQIYIASGGVLYKGTAGAGFTKMYDLDGQPSSIAASGQSVAIFEGKDEDSNSALKNSGSSEIIVINKDGKVIKSPGEASEGVWSQGGKYLATIIDGEAMVWDDSLHKVAIIPTSNINVLAWAGDSTIFYSVGSQLWSYGLQTGKAQLLASPSTGDRIIGVTVDQNLSYVYLLLNNQQVTPSSYMLVRLGLHNQPIATQVSELQVFLPNTVSGCLVGYLNFTRASITVEGQSGAEQDCIEQAKSYLQLYGINTGTLGFSFVPLLVVTQSGDE